MFGLNVSEYDCVCNCERGVSSYDVSVSVVSVVSVVSFVRVEGVFVRECANLCFCLCLSMYMCFFFSLSLSLSVCVCVCARACSRFCSVTESGLTSHHRMPIY